MLRLPENDQKAWDWIAENFSICSHDHLLSKKLWTRFSSYGGPVYALKLSILDLSQLSSYMHTWSPEGDTTTIEDYPVDEWPETILDHFVFDYLKTNEDAVVVCENANATREMYDNWQWGTLPPYWCYGENEVYHILTPADIGTKIFYRSRRQAFVNWGVGVCSKCDRIPESSITDESFFDEIVRNTCHIFLPAFDGDGFLIWTPQLVSNAT